MCVNCQNCEAVGKLFADLWKRLVFFHQVVNGFSIGTSGSFPYFHDARKSSNDQPVHRQRHIPHRHDQPPCQNETTDHTTDNKVQCKQGDPSTQGAAARHDPEAHPMERYFNPEVMREESELRQRIGQKLKLCPEQYLPIIEGAIDGAIKLNETEGV